MRKNKVAPKPTHHRYQSSCGFVKINGESRFFARVELITPPKEAFAEETKKQGCSCF